MNRTGRGTFKKGDLRASIVGRQGGRIANQNMARKRQRSESGQALVAGSRRCPGDGGRWRDPLGTAGANLAAMKGKR